MMDPWTATIARHSLRAWPAPRPTSTSGRVREALQGGRLTRTQLCRASGIPAHSLGPYIANDLRRGRIVRFEVNGVISYELCEATP